MMSLHSFPLYFLPFSSLFLHEQRRENIYDPDINLRASGQATPTPRATLVRRRAAVHHCVATDKSIISNHLRWVSCCPYYKASVQLLSESFVSKFTFAHKRLLTRLAGVSVKLSFLIPAELVSRDSRLPYVRPIRRAGINMSHYKGSPISGGVAKSPTSGRTFELRPYQKSRIYQIIQRSKQDVKSACLQCIVIVHVISLTFVKSTIF